jgi:hypothetical protein
VLGALLALSENRHLTPDERSRAEQNAEQFLRTSNLGYVVIDDERATSELREFAISVLGLQKIGESGKLGLFVPGANGGG